jgi:hypothetical protein
LVYVYFVGGVNGGFDRPGFVERTEVAGGFEGVVVWIGFHGGRRIDRTNVDWVWTIVRAWLLELMLLS